VKTSLSHSEDRRFESGRAHLYPLEPSLTVVEHATDMARSERGSAERQTFERWFSLASNLPWSSAERVYWMLTRVLLEHVMMTSAAASIDGFRRSGEQGLKLGLEEQLSAPVLASNFVSTSFHALVDVYAESLVSARRNIKGGPVGPACEWQGGCPARAGPGEDLPVRLGRFVSIESDHVVPVSRLPEAFGATGLQSLCAYHNREWKRACLAYGLENHWID
jgi:hypothetical protein